MVGIVMSTNEETGFFKCEICCNVFSKKETLKSHLADVHSEKCEYCGKVFYRRESLLTHMADVHKTFCFVCKLIFESKPDLLIHNLVCHDTNYLICGREKCLLQFKSQDELGAHLEEKHVNFANQRAPRPLKSCELCGEKFINAKKLLKHKINHHKVGDLYIQNMRLKQQRNVINNKGTGGEWKCGECKKEFKLEISLNHHFNAKHKPRKEDKLEGVKENEAPLEIEIKIEIKSEPTDLNNYYENILEMTDMKTEAIYNNDEEIEPEPSLEETLGLPPVYKADTDYNIKLEESAFGEAEYDIKVEESDEQMVVTDLKEETPEVIFEKMNNHEVEAEVGQDRKSGMIRVHLPAKFNNMQDDFIKEFFEVSYGKIIKFVRSKKVQRAQKKKGSRSFCWITFEDENASMFLDKQGHVMLDGFKLKTVACKLFEGKKTLRPPQSGTSDIQMQKTVTSPQSLRPPPSGTYGILMQKVGTSPESIDSLLLDLKVRTSMPPKEGSDNDSINSMEVECHSCLLCRSKRHADNLQLLRSRTMQKVKSRPKKKKKKTKHPLMAQLQAIQSLNTIQHQVIPVPQVAATPLHQVAARSSSQVAARPPPHVDARPPPQVSSTPPTQDAARPPPQVAGTLPQVAGRPPTQVPVRPPPLVPIMSFSSYYGYQNPPYGWPLDQAGHGYYPAQFGSGPWSGDRTVLGRPYCYYDDAGKLVRGESKNVAVVSI